jgi:peroxiredoxin Q/BCP
MRMAFVSSMWLIAATLTGAALAQTEFKPNTTTPPPTGQPAGSAGTSGRGRVSSRVAVGEAAPDFELLRIDGTPLRLSSLRGGWVMIWFVESRDSLRSVEPVAASLAKMDVRTLAVCYDKTQALAQRLHGKELQYVPLADPTGEIVSLYGLLDPERDMAKPGFVLVDPVGNVRLALLGHQLPSGDASRLVQLSVVGE